MSSFVLIDEDTIKITVSEGTPEAVLKNILDKLSTGTLENLSVSTEEESEIIRDDNLYRQATYRLIATTPATAIALDPDSVT